jgi:hypothetical protein
MEGILFACLRIEATGVWGVMMQDVSLSGGVL